MDKNLEQSIRELLDKQEITEVMNRYLRGLDRVDADLIASVFGEAGMHTRAAVSTNSLPLGVSVEVDAIFELK